MAVGGFRLDGQVKYICCGELDIVEEESRPLGKNDLTKAELDMHAQREGSAGIAMSNCLRWHVGGTLGLSEVQNALPGHMEERVSANVEQRLHSVYSIP